MGYEIGDLPLATLLPAIGRAEDQLARLDEVVRRSPVGQGFAERAHFSEAAASMWVAGEFVYIEDLVLHDADRDVRTPTHEITIAHSILRARRRIASAAADWATSNGGIASLIGRSLDKTEESQEGRGPSILEVARDVEDDSFVAEFAEIDALLHRSSHVIEAVKRGEKGDADALAVGELIIRDPEWDEDGRLSKWKAVTPEAGSLPVTLGAAVLWDAWESLEPLQRQHWLGAQLVNSYLRSRGKVSLHLGDIAPHLLQPDMRARLAAAKEKGGPAPNGRATSHKADALCKGLADPNAVRRRGRSSCGGAHGDQYHVGFASRLSRSSFDP